MPTSVIVPRSDVLTCSIVIRSTVTTSASVPTISVLTYAMFIEDSVPAFGSVPIIRGVPTSNRIPSNGIVTIYVITKYDSDPRSYVPTSLPVPASFLASEHPR